MYSAIGNLSTPGNFHTKPGLLAGTQHLFPAFSDTTPKASRPNHASPPTDFWGNSVDGLHVSFR